MDQIKGRLVCNEFYQARDGSLYALPNSPTQYEEEIEGEWRNIEVSDMERIQRQFSPYLQVLTAVPETLTLQGVRKQGDRQISKLTAEVGGVVTQVFVRIYGNKPTSFHLEKENRDIDLSKEYVPIQLRDWVQQSCLTAAEFAKGCGLFRMVSDEVFPYSSAGKSFGRIECSQGFAFSENVTQLGGQFFGLTEEDSIAGEFSFHRLPDRDDGMGYITYSNPSTQTQYLLAYQAKNWVAFCLNPSTLEIESQPLANVIGKKSPAQDQSLFSGQGLSSIGGGSIGRLDRSSTKYWVSTDGESIWCLKKQPPPAKDSLPCVDANDPVGLWQWTIIEFHYIPPQETGTSKVVISEKLSCDGVKEEPTPQKEGLCSKSFIQKKFPMGATGIPSIMSVALDTGIGFQTNSGSVWENARISEGHSIVAQVQDFSFFNAEALPKGWVLAPNQEDDVYNLYDLEARKYICVRYDAANLTQPTFHYVGEDQQIGPQICPQALSLAHLQNPAHLPEQNIISIIWTSISNFFSSIWSSLWDCFG